MDSKRRAEVLRRQGHTFADISRELGIAKSTAAAWLKNLSLMPEEADLVRKNLISKKAKSRVKARQAILNKTKFKESILTQKVNNDIASVELNQSYQRIMCSLIFWCEGGKDIGAGLSFINADPDMIKLFLLLLRSSFQLNEARFRVMLHLHSYHNETQQIRYWSEVTNIPVSQFYKPYKKPHTGNRQKAGYQGCISVRYLDAGIAKQLTLTYKLFASSLHRGVR